jgi:hypothetical protein
MEEIELTQKEIKAIKSLHRIAKTWPKTLWLFSANGGLEVMRCGKDGQHVTDYTGGMDRDYIVDSIDIPNDGGDW